MRKLLASLLVVAILGAVYLWIDREPPPGLHRRVPPRGLAFPGTAGADLPLRRVRVFPRLAFQRPVYLVAPPDGTDRLFVLEQDGRVLVFPRRDDVAEAAVFLDLSARVRRENWEEGLLGLAFSPDYAESGAFYLYYSASSPRRTVLSRFLVSPDPDRADPASEQVLLEIAQPYGNHNGGMIEFGPDGKLYVGVGDGGSGGDPHGHGQNKETLLGSILRLEPDGSVPEDNPFGNAVWAYGLRNPWRFSFSPQGRLWVGDVGQNRYEEIDIVERGGNYGWNRYEGTERYGSRFRIWAGGSDDGMKEPVHQYRHAPIASVTGGYVYRGTAVPELHRSYLFGDFVSGQVWALRGGRATEVASVPALSSFGEDAQGELYALSLTGPIYRFEARAPGEPVPVPRRLSETGLFANLATLEPAPGVLPYRLRVPFWSDGATKRRWFAVPGDRRIGFHPDEAWEFPLGTVTVKHFDRAGRRLETRVMVRGAEGWSGHVYRWNDEQTDAVLLDGRVEAEIEAGGERFRWTFPSPQDCLTCHTEAYGRVLGLRTQQVNREARIAGVVENQIDVWQRIGLFTTNVAPASSFRRLPAGDVPLVSRARAYLDVNCAMCHLPGGPTPGNLDLRFRTPLARMNLVNVPAQQEDGALRFHPGDRQKSVLWQRMNLRGEKGMPPLASNELDHEALELIGAWIEQSKR